MSDDPTDGPIVLFDGTCGFCDATVRWLIARDRRRTLRFAPLQSQTGQELLRRFGLSADYDKSLVLVEGDRATTISTGALRICRYLPFPWSLCRIGLVVPRFARDAVYNFIARRRSKISSMVGRSCPLPSPELRARFIE
jgi:predicted DCC family thiol-disulfide oxidoreductase YuxK